MGQWKNEKKKKHSSNEENKHSNEDKKNESNEKKDKGPKYIGIKVPMSEVMTMLEGEAKILIEGGNKLVDVAHIHNVKIPVTRELDVAIVEAVVPDGPMKGSVAYWLYHTTQDITIQKTDKHIRKEKKERRTELWNKFVNTISFGLF